MRLACVAEGRKKEEKMTIEKTELVLNNESGEKTVALDFDSNNACIQAGFSVLSGEVKISGKISGDDEEHELGFIDLRTGDIKTVATEGVYSLLGCEILESITFNAEEASTAVLKCLY